MKNENSLFYLQKLQDEHDLIAHQEVILLEKEKRLNHYALHFFKYAANICDLEEINNSLKISDNDLVVKFRKQVRDTFLLILAIANTYSVELKTDVIDSDFRNCLKSFYGKNNIHKNNMLSVTYKSILKNGSRIAKAIEAIDHLEPINIEESVLLYTKKMLSDILPVMALLQEEAGVYWEKEIMVTHATIKVKKPWIRAKCQKEFTKSDYDKLIVPLIDFGNNFDKVVSYIDIFVENKNKESNYNFSINEFPLDNEMKVLNNAVINNDLYVLQLLQNKQENSLIGFSTLKEHNIKKHLEKNLLKLSNRIRDLYVLNTVSQDNENKEEIVLKLIEAFEITFSTTSKLNQSLDFFFKNVQDIESKTSKDIFNLFYNESKFKTDANNAFETGLFISGDFAQILINLDLLKDGNLPISKELLLNLEKTSHFLCSLAGYIENKYEVDLTNELIKKFTNESILGDSNRKLMI